TVTPLNAAIYEVHETALAPVEDLALSVDDFETLCADGLLRPHAHHLTIKPHVRLWSASGADSARGSCHLEIEGFLPNSVLRIAGYQLKSHEALSDEAARQKVSQIIESSLVQ